MLDKHEDLSSVLRIHIKRWPMVGHIYNPSAAGRDGQMLASHLVSFEPMRDPVSKEAGVIPKGQHSWLSYDLNMHECLFDLTHICTYTHTHTRGGGEGLQYKH